MQKVYTVYHRGTKDGSEPLGEIATFARKQNADAFCALCYSNYLSKEPDYPSPYTVYETELSDLTAEFMEENRYYRVQIFDDGDIDSCEWLPGPFTGGTGCRMKTGSRDSYIGYEWAKDEKSAVESVKQRSAAAARSKAHTTKSTNTGNTTATTQKPDWTRR